MFVNDRLPIRWQEFDLLKEDAVIYKLVGPVLLKNDRIEATDNVNKRIEFITGEM
jgi:prefoldin beta subunit